VITNYLATYLIDHLTSSVAAISKPNDSPLAKNWVAETADAGGVKTLRAINNAGSKASVGTYYKCIPS
jgi:hypothetical protein